MSELKRPYHAYLLRIWIEAAALDRSPVWRCTLEDPHTRQRRGFATPEALLAFLEEAVADGRSEMNQENRGESCHDGQQSHV